MDTKAKFIFHRFSCAGVAPKDSYDSFVNRPFPKIYDTAQLEPFFVDSSLVQIGRLKVYYVEIAGQHWSRNRRHIRNEPVDDLCFHASLNMTAEGMMGDKTFQQIPGSAIISDLAQTSTHRSTRGQSVQLIIPRDVATNAGLDVAALHGLVLRPNIAKLLVSHLLQLREILNYLCVEDGPRIEQTILEILVLSIIAALRTDEVNLSTTSSARLARAQYEIQQNLGSSLLTVTNLSRRLSISRSSLHRMFETDGGVQAYIRNARLDEARLRLIVPAGDVRIVDVAENLGFADAAHFSRSFRQRFGETPTAYRKKWTLDPNPTG